MRQVTHLPTILTEKSTGGVGRLLNIKILQASCNKIVTHTYNLFCFLN